MRAPGSVDKLNEFNGLASARPESQRFHTVNASPRDPVDARRLASELGERPREVFRHLVDAFLTSGEPVGSRTLSQRLPLSLSPGLDPQCDGRSGGAGPASFAPYQRRAACRPKRA